MTAAGRARNDAMREILLAEGKRVAGTHGICISDSMETTGE